MCNWEIPQPTKIQSLRGTKHYPPPVTATHAPDSYPGRERKGCDEGSYTKYQPNPNLTLPIAQKKHVANGNPKNTKIMIINYLQPKPMGNTRAIGKSPNQQNPSRCEASKIKKS